mmetsp:Transcript_10847/g.18198  ORF Transcript_10847/g.18198 Transcript_10847/m.18198 type:complete len:434 (-) Transcript_10847:218-1519(-)
MQVAPCTGAPSSDGEQHRWTSETTQGSSSAYVTPLQQTTNRESCCKSAAGPSSKPAAGTDCDAPVNGKRHDHVNTTVRESLQSGNESTMSGVKRLRRGQIDIHPRALLQPLQRDMLLKFVRSIDHSTESLVITNPLISGNPIVYVTESWQAMCGFSYSEAVGQNPRLTQGTNSDPEVISLISGALSKRSACKVQLLNYRSGSPDKPFWNVLSISPLLYHGQLQLYIANLQDYSYHMSRMVSLAPSQFCRAAEHYQRGRHIPPDMPMLLLAKPALYEADEEYPLVVHPSSAPQKAVATPFIKRLGWKALILEPEHLTDRVNDALLTAGISFETQRRANADGETFVVDGNHDGVTFRVVVNEDTDGSYRITCARMSGDTFAYHGIFRTLKEHLAEAVHGLSAVAQLSTARQQAASHANSNGVHANSNGVHPLNDV